MTPNPRAKRNRKQDEWKEAYMELTKSIRYEVTAGANMIQDAIRRDDIFQTIKYSASRDTCSFILELCSEHMPKAKPKGKKK